MCPNHPYKYSLVTSQLMEMPSDPQGSSAESRPKFLQQTSSPRTQTAPLGTSVERWGRGKRGSARALRPQTDRQTLRQTRGWASSTRTEPQVWGAGPLGAPIRVHHGDRAPSQEGPMPSSSALPREMCWWHASAAVPAVPSLCTQGDAVRPGGGRKEPGSPRSAGRPRCALPPAHGQGSGGLQGPCREPARSPLS